MRGLANSPRRYWVAAVITREGLEDLPQKYARGLQLRMIEPIHGVMVHPWRYKVLALHDVLRYVYH